MPAANLVTQDPAPEFDSGPLSWVQPEIDAALGRGVASLAAFAAAPEDSTALKHARTHVHQAAGALQLVGLEAVVTFAEEIERQLARLDDLPAAEIADACRAIDGACRKLQIFLEELVNGTAPVPLKLFPEYEAMQRLRGVRAAAPTDLFYPDVAAELPRFSRSTSMPAANLPSYLIKQRRAYQRGLLGWLRGEQEGARHMRDAVAAIEAATSQPALRAFWWSAGALLDALVEHGLDASFGVKQLAARVDLQIRRIAEGSAKVAERLRREVLYFVAISAPVAPSVVHVQRAYKLAGLIPSAELLSSDLVRLQPHLREARELLASAKEAWLKCTSGRAENLPKLKQTLAAVHRHAAETGNGALLKLTQSLVARLEGLSPGNVSDPVAMEFATAMLLAESAFQNFGKLSPDFPQHVDLMLARLDAAQASRPFEGGEAAPMLDEMSKRAQDRLLLAQVGREIQANLRHMEQVLDAFFRDHGKRAELAALAKDSRQIRGALRMLGLDTAEALLASCEEQIEAYAKPAADITDDGLELLAESLSGLGFYVEAVEQQRSDHDRLIAPLLARRRGEAAPAPVAAEDSVEVAVRELRDALPKLIAEVHRLPDDGAARDALKAKLGVLRDDAELIGDTELVAQAKAALRELEQGTAGTAMAAMAGAPSPDATAPQVSAETQRILANDQALDAELLDIFLTEAAEVLDTVGEQRRILEHNPGDREALRTARRQFHTLKGSGRMVGLTELGEIAYEVEKIHNRLLEEERPVTPAVVAMIASGETHFRAWVGELKRTGSVLPDPERLHDTIRRVEDELPRGRESVLRPRALVAPAEPAEPFVAAKPEVVEQRVAATEPTEATALGPAPLELVPAPANDPFPFEIAAAQSAPVEAAALAETTADPRAEFDFSFTLEPNDVDAAREIETAPASVVGAAVEVEADELSTDLALTPPEPAAGGEFDELEISSNFALPPLEISAVGEVDGVDEPLEVAPAVDASASAGPSFSLVDLDVPAPAQDVDMTYAERDSSVPVAPTDETPDSLPELEFPAPEVPVRGSTPPRESGLWSAARAAMPELDVSLLESRAAATRRAAAEKLEASLDEAEEVGACDAAAPANARPPEPWPDAAPSPGGSEWLDPDAAPTVDPLQPHGPRQHALTPLIEEDLDSLLADDEGEEQGPASERRFVIEVAEGEGPEIAGWSSGDDEFSAAEALASVFAAYENVRNEQAAANDEVAQDAALAPAAQAAGAHVDDNHEIPVAALPEPQWAPALDLPELGSGAAAAGAILVHDELTPQVVSSEEAVASSPIDAESPEAAAPRADVFGLEFLTFPDVGAAPALEESAAGVPATGEPTQPELPTEAGTLDAEPLAAGQPDSPTVASTLAAEPFPGPALADAADTPVANEAPQGPASEAPTEAAPVVAELAPPALELDWDIEGVELSHSAVAGDMHAQRQEAEPPAPTEPLSRAADAMSAEPEPVEPVTIAGAVAAAPDEIRIGDVILPRALYEILTAEADDHLATLRHELELIEFDRTHELSAAAVRASHTLCGIHRTGGFLPVAATAKALEQSLGALQQRGHPVPCSAMPVLADAVRCLASLVARIKACAPFTPDELVESQAVQEALEVLRAETMTTGAALDRPTSPESGAESQSDTPAIAASPAAEPETPEPETAEPEIPEPDAAIDPMLDEALAGALDRALDEALEYEMIAAADAAIEEASDSAVTDDAESLDDAICAALGLADVTGEEGAAPIEALREERATTPEPSGILERLLYAPPAASGAAEWNRAGSQPTNEYGSDVRVAPASAEFAAMLGHVPETPVTAAHSSPAVFPKYDRTPLASIVDEVDAQLLPIFLEEAEELFPQAGEDLRAWRRNPEDRGPASRLRRTLHTFKGSARMAGAMRLGELAHRMESRLLSGEDLAAGTPELLEALDTDLDRIAFVLDALRAGRTNVDVPWPEGALESDLAASSAVPGAAVEPAEAPHDLASIAGPTAVGFDVPASAALAREPHESAAAELDVRERAMLRVRAEVVDRLVNEAGEVAITRARVEGELRALKANLLELTTSVIRMRGQVREIEIQAESQIQSRLSLRQETSADFDPLEFDRYTRFQELTRSLAEGVNDVSTVQQALLRNVDEADAALVAQARLLRDVQQQLFAVRTVPFASLSERLYRILRQVAKELDKRVDLDIRGAQVELDRSVLEKLAGPLEHLLRNAIDHGIEAPEARAAAGKPATGQITLTVRQVGNEIAIELADDGAGLDLERIRARAVAQGRFAPDAQPTEPQLIDCIFQHGFSTAAKLTAVSGRGIGMDVVRSEIAALGGRVEVGSRAGRGTTFLLFLPLTLAVAQAVLVRAGERLWAVPAAMVEQVQRLKAEALVELYRSRRLLWQGRDYAFHYLPRLLGELQQAPVPARSNPVLLLRTAQGAVGVHVDEMIGNQEVVVKNIGPQLARVSGIAGATVLGTGEIVLIINPVQLAHRPDVHRWELADEERAVRSSHGPADAAAGPPLALIVDDSLTVRKITSRLLTREGFAVETAKDGMEALQRLEERTPDVILLDIEMPRMDGFEFTKTIKADPRHAHIPIVIITSRTAEKHRSRAKDLGVDLYLGKPYQEEELLRHLHDMLSVAA